MRYHIDMKDKSGFNVKFYYDKNGNSDIVDFLDKLTAKAKASKSEGVLLRKIHRVINVLKQYGTHAGMPHVKYISGDLWELRPLPERIFFFYWKDNNFVLLHHFHKKTNKTPPLEIRQAQERMKDYIERNGE